MIEDLHQQYVHTRRVAVLCAAISELLPKACRVLDIGCGDGQLDAALLTTRPDIELVGTDILVRPQTEISVVPFDGQKLPFGDHSFDVALLVDVLHHAEDGARLLAEAARVSRKYIVIKDHVADGWLSRPLLSMMDRVGNRRHGVALPGNYLVRAEWNQLFQRLGLREVSRRESLGLYPWWADWLFGSSLHFLSSLEISPSESRGGRGTEHDDERAATAE